MDSNNTKSYATLIHLSALTQYFIPFGGFIFPILLWSAKKQSPFVDHHGKQVINFQLSVLLYSLIMGMIAIPLLLFTVFRDMPFETIINGPHFSDGDFTPAKLTGIAIIAIVAIVIFAFLKIAEFFLLICGAVMASNGKLYRYPFTIGFINTFDRIPAESADTPPNPDQTAYGT